MKTHLLLCAVVAGAFVATPGLRADEDTRRVQQALKEQGFYYGTVDGNPGAETSQAIRRFQIRNSLPVSGNLDEETRRAIEGAATAPRPTPPPPASTAPSAPTPRASPPPAAPRAPRAPRAPAPAPAPAPTPAPAPAPPNDGYGAPGGPPPPDGLSTYRGGNSIFAGGPYQGAPPFVQAATLGRVQGLLARQGFYNGPSDGIPGRRSAVALAAFQDANGLRVTGRLDHATVGALGVAPVYDERREFPRRPPRSVPRGPRYEGGGVYEGRIVPESAPR